jgi:uncharacterized OsmC-like protein
MRSKDNGFTMKTDFGELEVATDSEYGFRPYQLMIASIAGCSLAALKLVLGKMRTNFTDVEVDIHVERNESKVNRIEKIKMNFRVSGEQLQQKKIEKAGNIARKNCSMVQSVQDSIDVEETYEIVQG